MARPPWIAFLVGVVAYTATLVLGRLLYAYAITREQAPFREGWFIAAEYGRTALFPATLALALAGVIDIRRAFAGPARTGATVAAVALGATLTLFFAGIWYQQIWIPAYPAVGVFDAFATLHGLAGLLFVGGLFTIAWQHGARRIGALLLLLPAPLACSVPGLHDVAGPWVPPMADLAIGVGAIAVVLVATRDAHVTPLATDARRRGLRLAGRGLAALAAIYVIAAIDLGLGVYDRDGLVAGWPYLFPALFVAAAAAFTIGLTTAVRSADRGTPVVRLLLATALLLFAIGVDVQRALLVHQILAGHADIESIRNVDVLEISAPAALLLGLLLAISALGSRRVGATIAVTAATIIAVVLRGVLFEAVERQLERDEVVALLASSTALLSFALGAVGWLCTRVARHEEPQIPAAWIAG